MMAAMMRRLETDPSHLVIHDSSSGPSFLQLENLYPKCKVSQTPQHIPIPEHIMTLQYKEEILAAVDKTKEKVEELEKQLKQMEGTDSLGNVNYSDLCIHLCLKFPTKFKCPNLGKHDGKRCMYTHLKLYGAAMA